MITFSVEHIISFAIRVAPLLTLASVIVAVFTLREIRLQRQKAYEPQLFLANMSVWMQKNPNGTPCILKSDWKKEKTSSPVLRLNLHNIGLGAANTINMECSYNSKKLIQRFEKLGSQTGLLKSNGNGHFEYLFELESRHGYGFSVESVKESKEELSFLTAGQNVSVKIPETLYNYLTFIPYLELAKQNMPRRIDLKDNGFEMQFSFSDISGKRHRQRVKIFIEIYVFSEEFPENNYALATVSFKK